MLVKGLVFRQTIHETERLLGVEPVARALARMPDDVREQLSLDQLLASAWYPVDWLRELWQAIRAETDVAPEMLRLIGHDAVLATVSTVYRPALRLLSPATMVGVGAKLWRRVYDRGGYRVTATEPRRLALRFEGCAGFDHTMWTVLVGTVQAFVRLAGPRSVTVKLTAGGRDGDDWAELVGRWE